MKAHVKIITSITVITPTVQPSSQRTSLKFLAKLELLLRKHTLMIFPGNVASLVAGCTLVETSTDVERLVAGKPLHDKVLVSPDIAHTLSSKNTVTHMRACMLLPIMRYSG